MLINFNNTVKFSYNKYLSFSSKRFFSQSRLHNMESGNNKDHNNPLKNQLLEQHLKDIKNIDEIKEKYRKKSDELAEELVDVPLDDSDVEKKIDTLKEKIEEENQKTDEFIAEINSMYDSSRVSDYNLGKKEIYTGSEGTILESLKRHVDSTNENLGKMRRLVENSNAMDPNSKNSENIKELTKQVQELGQEFESKIAKSRETLNDYVAIEGQESIPTFGEASKDALAANSPGVDSNWADSEASLASSGSDEPSNPDLGSGGISNPDNNTMGVSSGSKRKRDDNEELDAQDNPSDHKRIRESDVSDKGLTSAPAPKKSSLLDDFADPSTEPGDFTGGDD